MLRSATALHKGLLAVALHEDPELRFFEIAGSKGKSPKSSLVPHTPQISSGISSELKAISKPRKSYVHPAPRGAVIAKDGKGVRSFCWSYEKNAMLIATAEVVEQLSVHLYVPLSVSPGNDVGYSVDSEIQLKRFYRGEIPKQTADISDIMRYRAERGYSLDLTANYWICFQLNQH